MNTTRRTLLGCCGLGTLALVAGCIGGDGDDGDGDGTAGSGGDGGNGDGTDGLPGDGDGNETGGTRPTGTGGPGVTLVSVDDDPDAPVRPAVEVTRDTATEEHPPRLTVTVTNESDRTLTLGEGRDIVFAFRRDTGGNLILLPADGDYPAEPDCWRLTDEIAVTEEYQTVTLDAGESVSREVDLYATPGEDACLPVGEYRFESPYSVMEGDGPDGNQMASFTWGFSILLE